MFTLTLRSVRAHRSRLTLTMLAIAMSVSFLTASFVLADSLRSVFGDVAVEIYDGVDAEVRAGTGAFDTIETGDRFPRSSIDVLGDIEGVSAVIPVLEAENTVFSVDSAGDIQRQAGPPTLTFSTFGDSAASPFTTVAGRAPVAGEVMLDTAQARALDVTVGDRVTIASPGGSDEFTLSGTITFGEFESGVSPYFLLFDLATTQSLLDAEGRIDSASIILDDGVELAQIRSVLDEALQDKALQDDAFADTLIVVDQQALVAEQNSEFGEVIDMIQTALLVFALITLFVSTFVIANTFAVVVGQQRRQIGLLRAVGALPGQAIRVVLAEAATVGVIASALGLAGGIAMAEGIKALVEAVTTGGFPDGPTRVLPRTLVVGAVLGIGVTTVSALIPARRAGRVAPLDAMRAASSSAGRPGGFVDRALTSTIGRLGAAGRLAASGVARNPRRVLATSMSMIIGLALITAMTVLTASYRSTLRDNVAGGFDADVIVTGIDGVPVPYDAITSIATLPDVSAASGFGTTEVRIATDLATDIAVDVDMDMEMDIVIDIAGFQPATADGVVALQPVSGDLETITGNQAIITESFADERMLAVADVLPVEFSDGYVAALQISAVVADSPVIDAGLFVDEALIGDHARNVDASIAAIRLDTNADGTAAFDSVTTALAGYPQLDVVTVADHVAARQALADQLLAIVNGLLALTIIVALTGIANTVALSLLERRAELGLLRAVGMSRRQIRRTVRLEAFTLSGVGAVVGIIVGVVLAAFALLVAPDGFIDTVSIPLTSIAVSGSVCVGCGVLAATLPARRAARLDPLDAIATIE
ncbi:MAG: FtsX-like permease family protein [Ilumatobacter sp.]